MKSLLMRRKWIGLVPVAAVALGCVLGGCESGGPGGSSEASAEALWVPTAAPTFSTFGRHTSFALTHESGRDLLVLEDPILDSSGDRMIGRLTWLVSIPQTPVFDVPIEVGSEEYPAWLVEQLDGEQAHAAPVHGRVIVHSYDAEQLSASLHVHAFTDDPSAGNTMRSTVDLDRKIGFRFYQPLTPQYQEMWNRGGSDSVMKKRK